MSRHTKKQRPATLDDAIASRGLTYESFADRAGVSVRTLYNLRNGVTRPTRGTLRLLSASLQMRAEELRELLSASVVRRG